MNRHVRTGRPGPRRYAIAGGPREGILVGPALIICLLAAAGCGKGTGNPVDPGSDPADPAPLADIVFADSTFAAQDWELPAAEVVVGPTGGSHTTAQRTAGGNPGFYREVVATKNATTGTGVRGSTWVYSISPRAAYTPSEQGAIEAIDFRIDGKQFVQFDVSGGSVGLALRQDGRLFFATSATSLPERDWTLKEALGITSESFTTHDDGDPHPDFSRSGGRITFGFIYGVSTAIDGPVSSRMAGFDNWVVTIRR